MQEIVNYLIENPDVLEKVVNGEASVIGLDKLDEALGLVEGLINSGRTLNLYWL
ncbi:competence pheromone ComX [Bacillus sp. FJAT-42376]|uniref:competence pheromone ComX n=1 Tax=Bacillus sp. FJAT-42376 TaxID=2014076 RepID=UPI000F4FF2E6|nr:competence pheromone ComX [Bacillus sp. FJAT-42376]AZB44233.1 competence pheromone ComX [Bacillus sp. FJAT-42376]